MKREEALRRLAEERASTLGQRHRLTETFDDIVEASRDSNIDDEHDTEGATIAVERQMAASLDREAAGRLALIDRAVARVDAGTYGRCLGCGGTISDGRLEARPAAELCIECAQTATKRRR